MTRKIKLMGRLLMVAAFPVFTLAVLSAQKRDVPRPVTIRVPDTIKKSLDEACKQQNRPPGCLQSIEQDPDRPGYERGVLIVKLKSPLAERLASLTVRQKELDSVLPLLSPSLRTFFRDYRVSSIEPLFDPRMVSPAHIAEVKRRFERRTRRAPHMGPVPRLDDLFKLTLDRQADLERAARRLSSDPAVVFAEPNRIYKVAYTPNDQYFNPTDLWGLFRIQASTAWNTATGQGVVVAVVDTGVDLSHSDLSSNIWTNTGEIAANGIDDDGNGRSDDVTGWDFAYNTNSPTDSYGHGTHVAGTIAAVGNNQHGIAGLAFQSKIMPLKGFANNGSGLTTDLANAMQYAINEGADVINNSWGGPDSLLVRNVVDAAHAMGLVVVSAAGNSNADACNFCPANAETGLTVSAFNVNDARAPYSNFGVKVDVGAPGGQGGQAANLTSGTEILSTVPLSSSIGSAGYPVLTGGDGKKYVPLAGTSMAAPHVSGLAALLIQQQPGWTNEEIRQAIRQSADDVLNSGFDTDSGYGRINAANAMTLGTGTARPTALITEPMNCAFVTGATPVKGLAQTAGAPGTYIVDVGAGDVPTSFTPIGSGNAPLNGTLTTFDPLNFQDGRQTIRVTTTDTSTTKKSEDRNVVNVDNVFISTPANNELLSAASYNVTGKVAGNLGFTGYTLEWATGCNATTGFQQITASSAQVPAVGPLGAWNLAGVPDGPITLKLRASFSGNGGFVSEDKKCVVVDKLLAPGWPAALNHVPSFKSPKIADLDGDGSNEVVLGASVFEANGTLRPGWNNFPGLGRTNPAILNVDNNPDLEVVTAVFDQYYANPSTSPNAGAPVIYAYKPNKSVLWSRTVQNPNTTMTIYNHGVPSSISAGDVDGDGQPEIVFTMFFSYYNSSYQTYVFVLDAATGAVQTSFPVGGISWSSVALADLDGNGGADLVLDSWINNTGVGMIYATNASGTALPGWPINVPAGDAQGFGNIDPVMADVDGDGRPEVLVGKQLRNYNGAPKTGWPIANLSRSTGVMAPLPDSDCEMEVRTGGANSVLYWAAEHSGTIPFTKLITFENLYVMMAGENGMQSNPVVADLDGDQEVEVLNSSELGSTANRPMLVYGSDALSAANPPALPRFVSTFNSSYADVIRSTPAIGDLDNDGKVDLVIAAGGQIYVWNLNQPYTPSLSYWPMFQHDLSNTGVTSASHWNSDLYLQDTPTDVGNEPNNISSLLYVSSDIWVLNNSDLAISGQSNPGPLSQAYFASEHQHQNPMYTNASTNNYVYVKVRNRGCKASAGTEKLRVYWAKASTGLPWPGSGVWNELDCVAGSATDPCSLPVIPAGQDYVAELPWVPPDPVASGTDHYCLIARIETMPTGSFGMTFPEGPVLWTNAANNNNIGWKNVTVVSGSGKGTVIVRNPLRQATAISLQFAVPAAEMKDNLLAYADVFVDLGNVLMQKWRKTGARPRGFEVVNATTVRILDPSNVTLGNLLFAPGEEHKIEVRMQIKPGRRPSADRKFNWDITQSAAVTTRGAPQPIGGERYTFSLRR